MKNLLLLILIFGLSSLVKAQEDIPILEENPVLENKAPDNDPVMMEEAPKTEIPSQNKVESNKEKEDKKTENNLKEGVKKLSKKERKANLEKGPALIAEHRKNKVKLYFFIGETLKYQTKNDEKPIKGVFEEIKNGNVIIDGKKVKVNDLIMVGKKFGKTMGWRTVGVSNFALGTGIAGAGAFIAIMSGREYSVNNPKVILATVGVTAGVGVGLVGLHLMVKGSKAIFQSANKKSKNGWTFRLQ